MVPAKLLRLSARRTGRVGPRERAVCLREASPFQNGRPGYRKDRRRPPQQMTGSVVDLELTYRLVHSWARLLFPIFFSLRVYGREHLPPSGGYIIGSNHQSFLDPVFIGLGVPRPINYLARRSLFRNKWFGNLLRRVNALPIETQGIDVEGIKRCIEALRQGAALVLFPEGTRTANGSLGVFNSGIAAVAWRADVPVVPAYIDGAFECWPRHRRLFTFAPVRVAFSPPIRPDGPSKGARLDFVNRLQLSLEKARERIRQSRKNLSWSS